MEKKENDGETFKRYIGLMHLSLPVTGNERKKCLRKRFFTVLKNCKACLRSLLFLLFFRRPMEMKYGMSENLGYIAFKEEEFVKRHCENTQNKKKVYSVFLKIKGFFDL